MNPDKDWLEITLAIISVAAVFFGKVKGDRARLVRPLIEAIESSQDKNMKSRVKIAAERHSVGKRMNKAVKKITEPKI